MRCMNTPPLLVEPAQEPLSFDSHRQLHWAAIRHVCRDSQLDREVRRAKLRFLVSGLSRGKTRLTAVGSS